MSAPGAVAEGPETLSEGAPAASDAGPDSRSPSADRDVAAPEAAGRPPPGRGIVPALGRALRVVLVAGPIAAVLLSRVPLCMFARVTHVPCPGCGLTRATFALLHGDLWGSLHLHPLAILVSPLVVGYVGFKSVLYVVTGRWWSTERGIDRGSTRVTTALVVLMMVVWAARFLGAFGGPAPV